MSQPTVEDNAEATELLRELREECAQIYELSVEEKGLIHQLCDMMSETQSYFKIGVNLSPSLFASKETIEKVVLTKSGDIVIIKPNFIESQHLSDFDSPTVVSVMKEAAGKITQYAKKYRGDMGKRISLLEKIARELKKLQDLNKIRDENIATDDYMMPEISSEESDNSQ